MLRFHLDFSLMISPLEERTVTVLLSSTRTGPPNWPDTTSLLSSDTDLNTSEYSSIYTHKICIRRYSINA